MTPTNTRLAPHALTLLAILTLGLSACGKDEAPKGPGAGAPPPPEVEFITASSASATITDDLPGRLHAVRTAQVRARVEGIVEKRLFSEGSDIREGAVLFRIDPRVMQANVDAARAALARAEADVAVNRQTVDRYQTLVTAKMLSPLGYDQAVAKLKQSEADAAAAGAALARARIDLANASVPAPISGRIGRALVTEGALVGKGEATHLATIEQIDPIFANFTQSNAELLRLQRAMEAGKLKQAGTAEVQLVMEDGKPYPLPGRLSFTDLAVDPNTGSVTLRAEFPNPQRKLLPGMFVRIRMPQALAENAIVLPQRAVQAGPQGQFVLTVDGEGKVAPRPVKVGGMSGGDWIIREGLAGGEKVIVNGVQKARPGTAVKAMPMQAGTGKPEAGGAPAPQPQAAAPAKPASEK